MQDQIEQMSPAPQTATAEEETGGRTEHISLGKFKDVQALLSAYNSLQSEFTKRCQRLKELESAPAVDKVTPTQTEIKPQHATEDDKQEILKDYVKGILFSKPTASILDGVGAGLKTPVEKPKNISEASKLAKEMFSKTNS